MALFLLERHQFLPISLDEAWIYFSNPANLKDITPPSMDFHVTSKPAPVMYEGMIISYTVKPMFGIPVRWVTEITHVREKEYFVDEQRFGPYSFWHHQHHLKAVDGGTDMRDLIHYKLPFGILGNVANALFVKKQLKHIFAYRKEKLERMFPHR